MNQTFPCSNQTKYIAVLASSNFSYSLEKHLSFFFQIACNWELHKHFHNEVFHNSLYSSLVSYPQDECLPATFKYPSYNIYITISNLCKSTNFFLQFNSKVSTPMVTTHISYCVMKEINTSYFVKFSKKTIICISGVYFQTEWHKELLQIASKAFKTTQS